MGITVIKGSAQQKGVTALSIHAPNIRGTPKPISINRRRGEVDSNRIIVGDFNASITSIMHMENK